MDSKKCLPTILAEYFGSKNLLKKLLSAKPKAITSHSGY
jgi:hypothetical protein